MTGLHINECSAFVEQSFEQKVNWQRAQLNGVQPCVVGLIKKNHNNYGTVMKIFNMPGKLSMSSVNIAK